VADARFIPRPSALWLRRAAVLPAVALVGAVIWLNELAPMRVVDIVGMLCVAGAWLGVVLWSLRRSPPIELDEHGLRLQSGAPGQLVPWAKVTLEREAIDRLDLRAGDRRFTIQPSLYAQPEALRRFVIERAQVGGSGALSPVERSRQT
jgi:hypothetical protein